MADTSAAVALNRVSTVLGYSISAANFNPTSPNLPQRIALIAEVNHANQGTVTSNLPVQITSAADAGATFGYGSPIHQAARILFPLNGGAVSCPVYVYPLLEAGGSTVFNTTITITGSTTATKGGTAYIKVNGRTSLDGSTYAVNYAAGITRANMAIAIRDAVNAVLSSPTNSSAATNVVSLTSKWYGATANAITISVIDNGGSGFTYAVLGGSASTGTPDITGALTAFGNDWNTLVINGLGVDSGTWDILEAYNGVPDKTNPTGRYIGTVMKPFVAFSGSVADYDTTETDSRLDQLTNVIAPAPLSLGLPIEAAANICYLWANNLTNTPHLDIQNQAYPDMPLPLDASLPTITMNDYNNRDIYVQKGNSTCAIQGGVYVVKDSVTTWHPIGEIPPAFRYVRTIMGQDMNYYYAWRLIELGNIIGHAILNDNDTSTASTTVKPKQVKALIAKHAADMVNRALIVDAAFVSANSTVAIDSINPDRLNIVMSYKRSGYTRIIATTVNAGFNNG